MGAELAIIGCGARTPLGFDRRSSAAAVRAGIITGTVALSWVAGALGVAGAALSAATFFGLM